MRIQGGGTPRAVPQDRAPTFIDAEVTVAPAAGFSSQAILYTVPAARRAIVGHLSMTLELDGTLAATARAQAFLRTRSPALNDRELLRLNLDNGEPAGFFGPYVAGEIELAAGWNVHLFVLRDPGVSAVTGQANLHAIEFDA